MRIDSQYGFAWARLLLVAAALCYAFTATVAPGLHYSGVVQAPHAHVDRSAEAGDPIPFFPDARDELDCLLCQALTHQPLLPTESAGSEVSTSSEDLPTQRVIRPHAGRRALHTARAPPSR